MKIEGPNKTTQLRGPSKTDGKKRTGDTTFSGMVEDTGASEQRAGVSGVTSLANLEALLSLQGNEDSTSEEAQRRAKKRGADLLDQLDKIRVGILVGGIPKSTLQQLAHMASTQREAIMDPDLRDILDEIELRAQVELAKHGR